MTTRLLVIVLFCFGVSCDNSSTTIKETVAATFDGGEIQYTQVDESIKSELYEQLIGVYYLRRAALEEVLAQNILKIESERRHLSVDSLLKLEVYAKLTTSGMDQFRKLRGYMSQMQDPENPLKTISSIDDRGNKAVFELYKKKVLEDFCNKLFKKYNVNIVMAPPLSPKINLEDIKYYTQGSADSPLVVHIISDSNCENCRKAFPTLLNLLTKYKDQIEFRYTSLSDNVHLGDIACACAAKQGQFLSVYKYIYAESGQDSLSLVAYAKDNIEDYNSFQHCLQNKRTKQELEDNMDKVKQKGLLNTPSVLINERIYYGQFTEEKLSEYIDNILRKTK